MAATDTTVISDYSEFLKEYYTPMIQNARQRKNVFLDDRVILFDKENVSGKYALIPVNFRSMAGIGSRAENGAMPIPDNGQYDTAKIEMTYSFAIMQISLQLMAASEGDRGSFNPAFAQETQVVMDAWLMDLNRQILGAGDGYLAMVDGSWTNGDTDAKDIDNAWGISATDAGSNGNGDLFISENLLINVFNGTSKRTDGGASDDGDIKISAFTRGAGSTEATITMDDSGTAVDGDYIVRAGNKLSGESDTYEANGLRLLIDDGTLAGTFQNISTTTRPDWKAFVTYGSSSGTAEPLTRARMMTVWNNITKRSSGDIKFLFCGTDTEEAYLELADSMTMTSNPVKLDVASNWEGPAFRGVPVISDPIYPEGRIEFIDPSVLAIYQMNSADWIPGDVGVLQKVAGYANYLAEFAWFFQFGIRDRSKVGSLRDISLVS